MKKLAVLLCIFGAGVACGQTAVKSTLESSVRRGPPGAGLSRTGKPNEIVRDEVTYSGIAVQVVKARNPLQLVNPAAPAQYGSSQDNLVRVFGNGRAFGLKIFSLRF